MREALRNFCRQYRIFSDAPPQPAFSSEHTWLQEDISGDRWVIKTKRPDERTAEILRGFSVLYTPFRYPRPVSQPGDPYFLYRCIPGELLANGLFESPEPMEKSLEVEGRMRALMRSLVLIPYYQEALRPKEEEAETDLVEQWSNRFNSERLQMRNDQQKLARLREAVESYQWMEKQVQTDCGFLRSQNLWPGAPLDSFEECIRKTYYLHFPIVGNNLAHCALHPEHLLLCPDGQIGIVGWHIAPRPRFYMLHTYLAWSFLHSAQPDPKDFYLKHIVQDTGNAFYKDHQLIFGLCLIEQLVQSFRNPPSHPFPVSLQRREQAQAFFTELFSALRTFMGS